MQNSCTFLGYSDRLKVVLNETGFIQGRGRLMELARFSEKHKTTARNWLENDICPRPETIEFFVRKLMIQKRLPISVTEAQVIDFLKSGHQNPFELKDESEKYVADKINRSCREIIKIYRMAVAQGVDLFEFDEGKLEHLYNVIFSRVDNTDGVTEITPQLLLNILNENRALAG